MASLIWNRDSQEAINNPYEYAVEEQFIREANNVVSKLESTILKKKTFFLNDKSLDKATWMLQNDVLFAFKDSLYSLKLKKHRIVGPLLRVMYENNHLIVYLNNNHVNSQKTLSEWYDNKSPRHFEYRKLIKETEGEEQSDFLNKQYQAYSKFTHRTYLSLLYNYAREGNPQLDQQSTKKDFKIWYDESWPLRQSISMYYAILGMFGKEMIKNLKCYGVLEREEVDEIWNSSMEQEQVQFGELTAKAKEMLGIE
ncbi:hypothetical protein [Psychroflexus sp. MES1-P1E]|uniref:hypothetical protein n=1 Tax=Psychroflexus sp. MES1-P1E TaxID=2058320 RepID=UPI000C79C9DF|nr:hypothetical protein [Psychroflexus sp. MES1-P1E]PKG42837.1 hypothetical protein CXF67_08190 [Psychroflexus sp. MES1-P1E]